MTEYAPRALRQIDALLLHYEEHQRDRAAQGLLTEAEHRIETKPAEGLRAPRPYPRLARPGVAWIKSGRYWIAYTVSSPQVIVAVFFETADIPGRL